MNQSLKDLWKKNFPLWPDVLVEKFAASIEIEANKFDSNYGANEKKIYADISNTKLIYSNQINQINFSITNTLLNPINQKYVNNFDFFTVLSKIFLNIMPEISGNYDYNFANKVNLSYRIKYDNRLFSISDDKYNLTIDYVKTDPHFYHSYYGVYLQPIIPNLNIVFNQSIFKPYNQTESIIALNENGYSLPNINYDNLYEFYTYLKSYQNYGAQIQGAADVAKKNALADILNYKSDLDSKLLAQKNNLQNLNLQLTSQTAAEAASAKRDMQQLSLQVATIKLQIIGLMK